MKRIIAFYAILAFFVVQSAMLAQPKGEFTPKVSYNSLVDLLPFNPKVKTGTLDNGMKYFIMENKKPEKRLELRIAVKAGSVLENDDQQGLAHFCEHMCFNGTKNFPKNDLIKYLESIGIKFGPEINAYTSFDETVYMLELPTDSLEQMEKGFQVLEDWAHNVTFEDEEIDKERGVILEEWRLGKGAMDRVMRKHYPHIFFNSRYADRLPIGDTNDILHSKYETLRSFYRDWYRPDLMAVFAVGDLDKADIEKLIREHFGRIKPVANPRPRIEYNIPNSGKVIVSVANDKELPNPFIAYLFLHDKRSENTHGGYRQNILEGLIYGMFNTRLQELSRKKDPPFLYAGGQGGRFVGDKRVFQLFAMVKGDGIEAGSEALLTESFRMQQHGFTNSELERQKKEALRMIESAYNEREKTESRNFASEYIRYYLEDEGAPGVEYELELYKKFLPEITLDELNKNAKLLITQQNVCIAVSAPDKPGIAVPDEAKILSQFESIGKSSIEPYKDVVLDKPLFDKQVTPGKIVNRKEYKDVGITEWKLSNGARVVLKPTDFKNDEILFQAYSPGGTSIASDDAFESADYVDGIVDESGFASFDATTLEKMLAGKIVSLNPSIGELTEGLRGEAAPDDIETLCQLVNLAFTAPRENMESFESYISKLKDEIKNRQNSPENAFRDTSRYFIANYHFRNRPLNDDVLKEIDFKKAYDFYKDRFADASDFTFFFVGNFTLDKIEPLVTKYIGSLPAIMRKENWKDVGRTTPTGHQSRLVKKGIEPKSFVNLYMTGKFEFSYDNQFKARSMVDLFRIRLREVVREDKGGVYGIGAWGRWNKYPKESYEVGIQFGCSPERVEELIAAVNDVIKELKDQPISAENLKRVKETLKREFEVKVKENSYWLTNLYQYYFMGDESKFVDEFNKYSKRIENLTGNDINEAATKYLDQTNYSRIVLVPED